MSVVRFVHTDFLRLGTPLTGLSDSPSWLQQLATGAVRQAVRNVIEQAVSSNAGFLLIAGSISEGAQHLQAAARWLNEQFETLRSHGIAVVTVAEDADTAAVLSDISDIVLRAGQSLQVLHENGNVRLNVVSRSHRAPGDLIVNVGDHNLLQHESFVYQACPTDAASVDCSRTSHDSCMTLSAGSVQSVSNDDTQIHGCIVVEANFSNQQLTSTFLPCDVVRFRTEAVTLPGSASGHSLVSEIVRASDSIDRTSDQTIIVDWLLQANLHAELRDIEQLNTAHVLAQLREHLHSGHRGIWPRTVSFSESTTIQLTSSATPVLEEFSELASPRVRYHDGNEISHGALTSEQSHHAGPELICGLTFLSRVA